MIMKGSKSLLTFLIRPKPLPDLCLVGPAVGTLTSVGCLSGQTEAEAAVLTSRIMIMIAMTPAVGLTYMPL